MHHGQITLAFVGTQASTPAPRRTPKPYRPNSEPSHKRPTGLLLRFRLRIERRLCWLLAVASHTMLKITVSLARNGFLRRAEIGFLFRCASRLNRTSIRLLRRGRW